MTALPRVFTGAWLRRSISLDGGPHLETQHVLWLQAGDTFADLRLPRDPSDPEASRPSCFSGTTSWSAPRLRWRHDLDIDEQPMADEGSVEWTGEAWGQGDLIERGAFGAVAYEEMWARLPVGDEPVLAVLERDDGRGRLVRVGAHALVLADDRSEGGGFVARYDRWSGEGWATALALGNASALPTPEGAPGWQAVSPALEMAP